MLRLTRQMLQHYIRYTSLHPHCTVSTGHRSWTVHVAVKKNHSIRLRSARLTRDRCNLKSSTSPKIIKNGPLYSGRFRSADGQSVPRTGSAAAMFWKSTAATAAKCQWPRRSLNHCFLAVPRFADVMTF